MYTLEITKEMPLPSCHHYTSICKVEDVFYCCNPCEQQIIAYRVCTQTQTIYDVSKAYHHLCYCEKENCFYALVEKECKTIYQLNMHFELICSYQIETISSLPFTCIAYHCDYVYVVQGFHILRIPTSCMHVVEMYLQETYPIQDIAFYKDYLVCTSVQHCCENIHVYACKQLLLTTCLPTCNHIVCLTSGQHCVYLLLCNACHEYSILVCHIRHCKKEHHGYQDLIQSIALMETSLSHILNAEGEKIQKAIAISDSISCLLKVNESVKETLTQVTHLEQVLFSKLELASKMKHQCDEECKKESE